jgi:hypothetical protein
MGKKKLRTQGGGSSGNGDEIQDERFVVADATLEEILASGFFLEDYSWDAYHLAMKEGVE